MPPGGSDLPSLLEDAAKLIEGLETRRQKDREIFDKVCCKLFAAIAKAERGQQGTPGRRRIQPRAAKIPRGPAPTVQDFHMEADADGRPVASFDHAKQITLPETLNELLAILAEDEETSPDGLVAWKSFDRLSD